MSKITKSQVYLLRYFTLVPLPFFLCFFFSVSLFECFRLSFWCIFGALSYYPEMMSKAPVSMSRTIVDVSKLFTFHSLHPEASYDFEFIHPRSNRFFFLNVRKNKKILSTNTKSHWMKALFGVEILYQQAFCWHSFQSTEIYRCKSIVGTCGCRNIR